MLETLLLIIGFIVVIMIGGAMLFSIFVELKTWWQILHSGGAERVILVSSLAMFIPLYLFVRTFIGVNKFMGALFLLPLQLFAWPIYQSLMQLEEALGGFKPDLNSYYYVGASTLIILSSVITINSQCFREK